MSLSWLLTGSSRSEDPPSAAGAAMLPRTIARGEPHSPAVELALQCPDLMGRSEDLGVLAMVVHQQAQQGEHVRHTQTGQSQQHDRPSCRGDHQPREYPAPPRQTLTCMDEVSGKHRATSHASRVGPLLAGASKLSSLVSSIPTAWRRAGQCEVVTTRTPCSDHSGTEPLSSPGEVQLLGHGDEVTKLLDSQVHVDPPAVATCGRSRIWVQCG